MSAEPLPVLTWDTAVVPDWSGQFLIFDDQQTAQMAIHDNDPVNHGTKVPPGWELIAIEQIGPVECHTYVRIGRD